MSEREWNVGDLALLPVVLASVLPANHVGGSEWITNRGVEVMSADLIPDDRHRTPIAPEDVREGDVVRLEWPSGALLAVEGTVRSDPHGGFNVDGYSVGYPGRTVYLLSREPEPTERDKWWPPQPGDQISDGVGRVIRNREGRWWPNPDNPNFPMRACDLWTDADVPDDAVLILPAQTREAAS